MIQSFEMCSDSSSLRIPETIHRIKNHQVKNQQTIRRDRKSSRLKHGVRVSRGLYTKHNNIRKINSNKLGIQSIQRQSIHSSIQMPIICQKNQDSRIFRCCGSTSSDPSNICGSIFASKSFPICSAKTNSYHESRDRDEAELLDHRNYLSFESLEIINQNSAANNFQSDLFISKRCPNKRTQKYPILTNCKDRFDYWLCPVNTKTSLSTITYVEMDEALSPSPRFFISQILHQNPPPSLESEERLSSSLIPLDRSVVDDSFQHHRSVSPCTIDNLSSNQGSDNRNRYSPNHHQSYIEHQNDPDQYDGSMNNQCISSRVCPNSVCPNSVCPSSERRGTPSSSHYSHRHCSVPMVPNFYRVTPISPELQNVVHIPPEVIAEMFSNISRGTRRRTEIGHALYDKPQFPTDSQINDDELYPSCPTSEETPISNRFNDNNESTTATTAPSYYDCHDSPPLAVKSIPQLQNAVRIPPEVISEMFSNNSRGTRLRTEFVRGCKSIQYSMGIPWLEHSTRKWIRVVLSLQLICWTISVILVSLAVSAERLPRFVLAILAPTFTLQHFIGYLSFVRRNAILGSLYCIMVVIEVTFESLQFASSVKDIAIRRMRSLVGTLLRFVISFCGVIVGLTLFFATAALFFRMRQEESDINILIPIETLEETPNEIPFLKWYFSLPLDCESNNRK